jgi:hypothetical protein
MTKKPYRLFVDQYGQTVFARTVKELHEKGGPGRVSKMYRDTKDGRTLHVGYVVGRRWFDEYAPVERLA